MPLAPHQTLDVSCQVFLREETRAKGGEDGEWVTNGAKTGRSERNSIISDIRLGCVGVWRYHELAWGGAELD
jgi:hypothetical protein